MEHAAVARREACFEPYHAAIRAVIERFQARGHAPAVISMHSFTPVFKGDERPWHIGILWADDERVPVPLIAELRKDPEILVGDNEPYNGKDHYGYSIMHHAEERGLPHVLIEIRQDFIDTHHGAAAWSERLARAFTPVLARDSGIYTTRESDPS